MINNYYSAQSVLFIKTTKHFHSSSFCLKFQIQYPNIIKMKFLSILSIASLLAFASAIPWKSQIALANALEVGRD